MWGSYQESVRRFQNPVLDHDQRMAHALYGIGSEIGEVVEVLEKRRTDATLPEKLALSHILKKELGDVCWFIAELADVEGLQAFGDRAPTQKEIRVFTHCLDLTDMCAQLVIDMGRLYSIYQHAYQGEPVERGNVLGKLRNLLFDLACIAYMYGFSIGEVLLSNVEKLERRYRNGHYVEKESIERTEH